MEKKVIYYSDPLNDDFAISENSGYTTPENYKYKMSKLNYFFTSITYHLLIIPIAYIVSKVTHGIKIYGRKNIKGLKGGFYVYANHTTSIDPFYPALAIWPKRSYCVGNPVISRFVGLRGIIKSVGGVPVPTSLNSMKSFINFQESVLKRNDAILIYPEAHIWLYYNSVRYFRENSFKYPIKFNKPIVCVTTVFKAPKKEGKHPKIKIYVSKPIYPNESLDSKERVFNLRDMAYNEMLDTTSKNNSYEFIRYVYKEKEETK